MLLAFFSVLTFAMTVHSNGGENCRTLAPNQGSGTKPLGVIAFFTTRHLEQKKKKKEFLDVITHCITFLSLSPCFLLFCVAK